MALGVLLFSTISTHAGFAEGYVFSVYLENEGQFRFVLFCGDYYNTTKAPINDVEYYVNANQVGATMFDKIHAQALSAMNNQHRVWIDYSGSSPKYASQFTSSAFTKPTEPNSLCP